MEDIKELAAVILQRAGFSEEAVALCLWSTKADKNSDAARRRFANRAKFVLAEANWDSSRICQALSAIDQANTVTGRLETLPIATTALAKLERKEETVRQVETFNRLVREAKPTKLQ